MKTKLKKLLPILLSSIILFSIPNIFVKKVYAAETSASTLALKEFPEKLSVSSIKAWKINFNYTLDYESLEPSCIYVTNAKGETVTCQASFTSDYKGITLSAPTKGYNPSEVYYLNISSKITGVNGQKILKQPIKMKFTITDIGTSDINENSEISKANNIFSFNLIKELVNEDANENMIISPFSISTVLAITQNGAIQNTKQEILDSIGFKNVNINDKDINEQYYSTLDYYNNLKLVTLKVANSVWANNTTNLNTNFKDIAKKYYNSQTDTLDFSNSSSLSIINNWVDKNTDGQIKYILKELDSNSKAVLINAVNFKGTWQNTFENNGQQDFTLTNGKKIKTDTMTAENSTLYFKGDNFEAISVPYCDNLEMDIFLPDKGTSINDFIKSTTKANFDTWRNNFTTYKVNQQLPKFKMEYEKKIIPALKNLGINQMFNGDSNLDGIAKGTLVSDVTHKACINVDEKGTEAAAATSISFGPTSIDPAYIVNFVVDRPFFFVIRDNKTGIILFMGKVENPLS